MRVERHWGSLSPSVSLSLSTVSPGAWPARLLSRGMHFYNCSKFRLQHHQVPPTAAVPVNSTPLQDRSPPKISGRPHHSPERRLQSTTTPGSCVYRKVICRSPFSLFRLQSAALQRSCALLRSTPSSNGCYVIGDAVMISRSVVISVNCQMYKTVSAALCY